MNVCYTAITGGKDLLKETQNTTGAKFVAFVDRPIPSTTWELRDAHTEFSDPNRNAKIHKVNPHVYFPEAEYSLWVDGTIEVVDPMDLLIERYLEDADIALFKHYERNCAYSEAMVCGAMGLDDQEVMSKQMARYYMQEQYPIDNGLAECTIILRRHTPKIQKLNEMWWAEIQKGSRRDQLSFNYCCWKLGIEYNEMEGTVYQNSHFLYTRHLK